MEEKILDLDYENTKVDKTYFKRSLKKMLIAWGSIILLVILSVIDEPGEFKEDQLSKYFIIIGGVSSFFAAFIFSLLGFINGIQSYLKKEKVRGERILVLIGNFLLFGGFIILVISSLSDFMKF